MHPGYECRLQRTGQAVPFPLSRAGATDPHTSCPLGQSVPTHPQVTPCLLTGDQRGRVEREC